jgi:hypothetical protein
MRTIDKPILPDFAGVKRQSPIPAGHNGPWTEKAWALAKALALCSLLLSMGCASAGNTFKHEAAATLELGQLRTTEYRQIFGEKPTATSVQKTEDGTFEIARYMYAHADLGTAQARCLVLEFKDGVLNSYNYVSSFSENHQPVDLEKADQIKKGASNKNDVQQILGKPDGKALSPSSVEDFKDRCKKGAEVWTWQAMRKVGTFAAAGGKRPEVNSIFVIFNKDGIVNEVQTESSR